MSRLSYHPLSDMSRSTPMENDMIKTVLAALCVLALAFPAYAKGIKVKTSDFDGQTVVQMKRSHVGCAKTKCAQFTTEWQSNHPSIVLVTVNSTLDSITSVRVNVDGETYDFSDPRELSNDNSVRIGNTRLDYGSSNSFTAPLSVIRAMGDGERVRLRVSGVRGYKDYVVSDAGKKPMQFIKRLPEFFKNVDSYKP